MRAMAIAAFGGSDRIQLMDLRVPAVAPDEVLIQVKAAGIGPWDILVRENRDGLGAGRTFPIVLGWECAGVVVALGAHVTTLAVGDAVFAYPFQRGNYADYVAAPIGQVAHKPHTIGFIESAALPVSGVTAVHAISEVLDVQAGETVLITGAAGGTGMLAVQLAAARGARVIATASPHNRDFVQRLGAAEVFDYRAGDVAAAIRAAHPDGMDAVMECVASPTGDTFFRSVTTLRPGGRVASIVSWPDDRPLRADITATYVLGRPDARLLEQVAALVDVGALRVEIEQIFPLEQAAQAQHALATHHHRGQIVLRIDEVHQT